MDFGVPGADSMVEMLQGAIGGAQHPALRTGDVPYQLVVPTFMPDRIAVVSLQGREAVNELYEYDVQVVSPFPPEIIQPAIFGANAALLLNTPGHEARVVQGMIVALACCGIADRGLGKDLFQYELTIAPPMWLWTQRERNRVFQDKTVLEVAESMLKADGIHYKFAIDDKDDYRQRALYYQRDENDFEFFKRILADSGIYFLFNHAVHDTNTKGIISDIATGGSAIAGAGSALSSFGAKSAGSAMGSFGGAVQEVTKGVTMLVLGDDDDGVVPLHDFAAAMELGDLAAKKALSAASSALGGVSQALGDKVKGAVGLDASDQLPVDDGYGGPDEELVLSVELRRRVRPKSTWMLERDHRAPESWAHIQRNEMLDPKIELDVHLRVTPSGVGVDGGAKVNMDIDAPWIDAKKLEKELIQRNMIWRHYPSESRPKRKDDGGVAEGHEHLKRPLEQMRRDAQTALVTTSCRRLGAGYRFNVIGHRSAAYNMELTVLELRVEAVDPEMLQLDPNDPLVARPFVATLTCAPADDYAPRPPLPPRRRVPMELGTVIRWQESMDMVADARNDVYVRLDWDVTRDDDKERWYTRGHDKPFPLSTKVDGERDRVLRVPILQPWAGNGFGLQVVPREGMQVLVGYLDSQGDRPILLGCLHNDKNPPPWGPGYDAQRVGFRTQSRLEHGVRATDGATIQPEGYSEISIDDSAHEELIRIRAEKDLKIGVGDERTATVGSSSSDSVGGDRTEHTEGDYVSHVQGDATATIHGRAKRHVLGSSEDVVFVGRTSTTGGDATEHVRGSSSVKVDGEMGTTIGGSLNTTVKGNHTLVVDGGQVIQVGRDFDTEPAQTMLFVEGGVLTSAKGLVTTTSEKNIVFECGTSRIEIGPKAIKIHAESIEVVAEKTAKLATKDATLDLSSNVEAYAKELHFFSSGAALDLTSTAKVTASSVSLASGSGKSKSADDKKDDDKKKKTVKVCLLDDELKPLSGKTAYVYANGERTKATTDGDGGLSVDVDPAVTKELTIRVWEKDFPSGASRDHVVTLVDSMTDLSSPKGVMIRLANLGFHSGSIGTTWGEARAGLLRFQLAHAADGLEATGKMDDKTKSKLQDKHKG